MKLSEKQKGLLALIGLALIYASLGIFARFLSVDFGLFQQVYLRMLSAVLFGLILFRRKLHFSKLKQLNLKEWFLLFFRSISYYLFGVVLFTKAALLTKISTLSFIGSLPMTAILGFVLLQEKLSTKKIFYILLAFIGVITIAVKDFSSTFVFGQGEILALVSTILASLSIVFRKYQTKLLNNFEISQIMLVFAFISVFITSFFFNEKISFSGFNLPTLMVIFIAGFANILVILFTNYGFEKVRTSLASNILNLEMFFGVLIGLLFYREIPSIKELTGGVLILFSVIKMNKLEE